MSLPDSSRRSSSTAVVRANADLSRRSSSTPVVGAKANRVRSLDMLRAIAVLLVIGHHSGYAGQGLAAPLAAVMSIWNRSGWMGVDLFFVLSGFLVSGLLFRERRLHGRIRLGHFLIRRGLKIYPAFYAYLAVVLVHYVWAGYSIPT